MHLNKMPDITYSAKLVIVVKLLEKVVGEIRHDPDGWRYYPKGSKTGGEAFADLPACQKSLEQP